MVTKTKWCLVIKLCLLDQQHLADLDLLTIG